MSYETIFDHRTPPKHYWVQAQVYVFGRVKNIRLRLTQAVDENGDAIPGGFEITDFRAPDHPEIDWAWLDTHAKAVWAAVQFNT